MKKNIILTIVSLVLVCSAIINVVQSKTINSQHETIKEQCETIDNFKKYYNAAEDLLESIDADINISDTYMCGDIGADYLYSVSKIDDSIRVKPSDYKPINPYCYGE